MTSQEKAIFSIFNKIPDAKFYVEGGWVRDKVLGLQSNDIDIVFESDKSAKDIAIMLKNIQNDIGIGRGEKKKFDIYHLGINGQ